MLERVSLEPWDVVRSVMNPTIVPVVSLSANCYILIKVETRDALKNSKTQRYGKHNALRNNIDLCF